MGLLLSVHDQFHLGVNLSSINREVRFLLKLLEADLKHWDDGRWIEIGIGHPEILCAKSEPHE